MIAGKNPFKPAHPQFSKFPNNHPGRENEFSRPEIGAIDKPCGESVRRLTQKHVAKRYMIAEKLLSLHHESYQQYKYV